MKKILIINGSGGVGKDTFVQCIGEFANVEHTSIAKLPKDIAKIVGWNGEKQEKDRKFLSDLKILIDEYSDKNYELMRRVANKFLSGKINTEFLCIDMREKDQIERFKKEFDAITVLIKRDSVKPILSNPADANVFDVEYDYVIENNGTIEDLKQKASAFVKLLRTQNVVKYEKIVYISHPYGGDKRNQDRIEAIIEHLSEQYPTYQFVSAVHAFGFKSKFLPYEVCISECLWLLEKCDEMWIFGNYKSSRGCKDEIEYCENNNIKHGIVTQFPNGEMLLIPPCLIKKV